MQDPLEKLARAGCYLSEERIAARAPLVKNSGEIRVLIVEDDPSQLALAGLRASMGGYVVRLADSAAAMRRLVGEHGVPDIVLLDVMPPDGDGFEILAGLRQDPASAELPVILLTAKTSLSDIERGIGLGADGYVSKPYSYERLNEVIRKVLKVRQRAAD